MKRKEEEFVKSFTIISGKMMKTYNLFFDQKPAIQEHWLKFVSNLDKELYKSLKQAVKNSLTDLMKRIKCDKTENSQPIFRVYTVLMGEGTWRIEHQPKHEELKESISNFIRKIIMCTQPIPLIEKIFREQRDIKLLEKKKEVEEKEKQGGGGGMADMGIGDEDFEARWAREHQLPKPYEPKLTYNERIAKHPSIKQNSIVIVDTIETIKTNMDDDEKYWKNQPEFRHLYNIKTDKGRKRILLGRQDQNDHDPVQRYSSSIEHVRDQINDINNQTPQKAEGFIMIDYSKLKSNLMEYSNEYIQTIYQFIIQEAKQKLNALITEFETIISELSQPCINYEHLKRNKEKFAEVKNQLPEYEGRIEPIKKLFNYISTNEQEIGNNELTEEDKNKLAGLDDAWVRFKEGLENASIVIQKSNAQLKQEMDSTLEDFNRDVKENLRNFQSKAPYYVDSTITNSKAKDILTEFKNATQELREKEESYKFGLEIFGLDPQPYPQLSQVEKEIEMLTQIWA